MQTCMQSRPDVDWMIKPLKKRICLTWCMQMRDACIVDIDDADHVIGVGIEPAVIPSWRCWLRKTHSWPPLRRAIGVIPSMLTDLSVGIYAETHRWDTSRVIPLCLVFSLHAFPKVLHCFFIHCSVHSKFSSLPGYFINLGFFIMQRPDTLPVIQFVNRWYGDTSVSLIDTIYS
jgi:hypothetical protein